MITTLQFHIKMSQERMVNKFSYCTILEKLQNKAKYLITFWEDCIQNWLKLKQAHCVNIAKIYHNFLWRWKMLALILWQHGGLIKMQDKVYVLFVMGVFWLWKMRQIWFKWHIVLPTTYYIAVIIMTVCTSFWGNTSNLSVTCSFVFTYSSLMHKKTDKCIFKNCICENFSKQLYF